MICAGASLYCQPELSVGRTWLVLKDIQHKLNMFSLSRGSPHFMVEKLTGWVFKSSFHNIPDSFLPLHRKQFWWDMSAASEAQGEGEILVPVLAWWARDFINRLVLKIFKCGVTDSRRSRVCNSCRVRWWPSLCINVDHFNLFFYTWGKYTSSLVIFELNRFICQDYESTTHLSGMQATCNSVKRRKAYFFIWFRVKRLKLTKDSLLAPSCQAVSPPDRRLSVSYSKCGSYCLFVPLWLCSFVNLFYVFFSLSCYVNLTSIPSLEEWSFLTVHCRWDCRSI